MSFENADEVLEFLLEGNKNFANNTPKIKNHCFETLKQSIVNGQNPHALVLGCSDSRVSPEIIFDTGLGELFVVRTAGHAIGPNILESIEYGIKNLNIKLLVILGHQDCGVMKYALNAPLYNAEFENLIYQIQAVKMGEKIRSSDDLTKSYTDAARQRLLSKSKIICNAVETGELKIVRAYFSLENGLVEIVG